MCAHAPSYYDIPSFDSLVHDSELINRIFIQPEMSQKGMWLYTKEGLWKKASTDALPATAVEPMLSSACIHLQQNLTRGVGIWTCLLGEWTTNEQATGVWSVVRKTSVVAAPTALLFREGSTARYDLGTGSSR